MASTKVIGDPQSSASSFATVLLIILFVTSQKRSKFYFTFLLLILRIYNFQKQLPQNYNPKFQLERSLIVRHYLTFVRFEERCNTQLYTGSVLKGLVFHRSRKCKRLHPLQEA